MSACKFFGLVVTRGVHNLFRAIHFLLTHCAHVFRTRKDMLHILNLACIRVSCSATEEVSVAASISCKEVPAVTLDYCIAGELRGIRDSHSATITPFLFFFTISNLCTDAFCSRRDIYPERHYALESHCRDRPREHGQCRPEKAPHPPLDYKQTPGNTVGPERESDMDTKTAGLYQCVGCSACYGTKPGQKWSVHNGHCSSRRTLSLYWG